MLGVHAATGRIMWRYPYPADFTVGLLSTPVAIGSRLFLCAGEGMGKNFSACLEMQAADGKISYRELYRSTELQTNMYHTVSVVQDAVFGFGGGAKAGFLHCTNLADGRLLWKEESRDWTKDQNMVIADGLIFALTRRRRDGAGRGQPRAVSRTGPRESRHEAGPAAAADDRQRPDVHPRVAGSGLLPSREVGWVLSLAVVAKVPGTAACGFAMPRHRRSLAKPQAAGRRRFTGLLS